LWTLPIFYTPSEFLARQFFTRDYNPTWTTNSTWYCILQAVLLEDDVFGALLYRYWKEIARMYQIDDRIPTSDALEWLYAEVGNAEVSKVQFF